MLYIALAVLAVLVLLPPIILFFYVDDWSRDLSKNYSATDEQAKDAALRPIEMERKPTDLAILVRNAAADLPRWRLVEDQEQAGVVQLHFERRTPLMGYVDDVRVRIEPTATGARLTAESQSRVGKGDLGQNPRNLKELLQAVRKR